MKLYDFSEFLFSSTIEKLENSVSLNTKFSFSLFFICYFFFSCCHLSDMDLLFMNCAARFHLLDACFHDDVCFSVHCLWFSADLIRLFRLHSLLQTLTWCSWIDIFAELLRMTRRYSFLHTFVDLSLTQLCRMRSPSLLMGIFWRDVNGTEKRKLCICDHLRCDEIWFIVNCDTHTHTQSDGSRESLCTLSVWISPPPTWTFASRIRNVSSFVAIM